MIHFKNNTTDALMDIRERMTRALEWAIAANLQLTEKLAREIIETVEDILRS